MVWHTVDISPDSHVSAMHIAGVDVLMIDTDGGWLAVEDRCSHADCAFSSDGEIDGSTVICNCHGSEFDLRTGDVLVPPAFDPIRTFRVRTTDGGMEIEL